MKKIIIIVVLAIGLIIGFLMFIKNIQDRNTSKTIEKAEKQSAKVDSNIRVDSTKRYFNAEKRAYSDSCNAELQYKYNQLVRQLNITTDNFNKLVLANKDTNCIGLIQAANEKFYIYDTIVCNRNNYISNLNEKINLYKADSVLFIKNLNSIITDRNSWKQIAEKPKTKTVLFISGGLNSFGYATAGGGIVYNKTGLEINYLFNTEKKGIELKGIYKF